MELRKPNDASAGQGMGWAWEEDGEQDLPLSAAEKLNCTVGIGGIDLKEQLNDNTKILIFWFFNQEMFYIEIKKCCNTYIETCS